MTRGTTASTAFGAILGIGILAAQADVRVWTDREEIVLKGTLQGIEVLPDGAAAAAPTAATDLSAEPLRTIAVASTRALYDAIAAAEPGDRIVLAAGIHVIDRNSIALNRPGTATHPITLTAEKPKAAVVRMTGENGFFVSQPYWVVENLVIVGACNNDDTCEHAFHIVGAADHTVVRNNRIVEFNAAIKGNGTKTGETWTHPDFVLIDGNDIYNTRPRETANPVTGIDVVGGRGWIVRANYIADLGKRGGNGTSYAAFLKGGSSDGVFERNLVACRQTHSGGLRVGLSFGGGGSNLGKYCNDPANCKSEHRNGTMRNNIILACNDVGIYLNRAADTRIFNNIIYDTQGIDVRYVETSADIRNNILSGPIRVRDGAESLRRNNVIVASPLQFNTWFAGPANADFSLINPSFFVDKGEDVPDLDVDFCGNRRNVGTPDVGAIEFIARGACDVAARMKMDD